MWQEPQDCPSSKYASILILDIGSSHFEMAAMTPFNMKRLPSDCAAVSASS